MATGQPGSCIWCGLVYRTNFMYIQRLALYGMEVSLAVSYLHAYSCVYSLLLVLSHSCVFPTSLSVPLSRSLDTVQRDLCARDLCAVCDRFLECRPPYVSQHLKVYCMYCGSCLLDGTTHNVKRFSYLHAYSCVYSLLLVLSHSRVFPTSLSFPRYCSERPVR